MLHKESGLGKPRQISVAPQNLQNMIQKFDISIEAEQQETSLGQRYDILGPQVDSAAQNASAEGKKALRALCLPHLSPMHQINIRPVSASRPHDTGRFTTTSKKLPRCMPTQHVRMVSRSKKCLRYVLLRKAPVVQCSSSP